MSKISLYFILLILFNSCSSKNGLVQDPLGKGYLYAYDPSIIDSDGDYLKDQEEMDRGRNPFIADLPPIDIKFLTNYSIVIDYQEENRRKQFKVETQNIRGQAGFKYNVGDILIREESFKQAAIIGAYDNHHMGEISDKDLTLVKYPAVDKKFFLKTVSDFKEKITEEDFNPQNITIKMENSIRLENNGGYDSIKNLQLDFYFHDVERKNNINLGRKKIQRHFTAGVEETFEVTLENVPLHLIRDGYFSRGEFVISEIYDYEIPALQTTYRQLMASVQEKTIPIVFNTPLKSEIFHVSLGRKKKRSFQDILTVIFADQYAIKDNILLEIGQFKNNLEEYTYLHELRNQDKRGKWFVFTSPLNQHYLDYQFTSEDKISLSYVTGNLLTKQSREIINTYDFEFSGGEYENTFELGETSGNS
ncbi:MAG: hypothetical protein OXB84_04830, partial [Halobacteriovoraceae bacterium]|nr:hypothetical protein [Halobacteriovoraceae bacterium]